MGAKIFMTGATGYIGGTVLEALTTNHPEYEITALLRNVPEGFAQRYPKVKVINGNYDSHEVIATTAAQNDIVIHSGKSKYSPPIKAHIEGLLRRPSTSPPGYFIRLGGTGAIADWHDETYYGERNPKVWSDIDDIDTLTSLPDWALHRPMEKYIQEMARQHHDRIRCAIICSSGVYGRGRGMVRTQSLLVPDLYAESTKLGHTFYTGSGGNTRGWVHVDDLMLVYLGLVEAAVAGGGKATWGVQGYYFTATQEVSQRTLAEAAGRILYQHQLVKSPDAEQLPLQQIRDMDLGNPDWGYEGIYTFASNTRVRADRAKRDLEYSPKAPSLLGTLESDLLACRDKK